MKCVLEFGNTKMGFGQSVYQNSVKKKIGFQRSVYQNLAKKTKKQTKKQKNFGPLSELLTRFTKRWGLNKVRIRIW